MRYVLFNPLSSNCLKEEEIKEKVLKYDETKQLELVNVIASNVETIFDNLKTEDDVVLIGGDGTLNNLINRINVNYLKNDIYLLKGGNGNDFLRDINDLKEDFIKLNPYLVKLPCVTINDKTYYYINGIGFGIDGLVCVVADEMKKKGKTNINYTSLSIKLLLGRYKVVDATVNVDGKEYKFKRVWLASSMNGKYYGGGMKVAPDQDRLSDNVTVCVWHSLRKLKALMMFPKIFKGEHVKDKKHVAIFNGKNITVTFSKPTGLQIDGESFDNITTYTVKK